MNQINIQFYKIGVGELILGSFENKLCMLDWRFRKTRTSIDKRLQTALQAEFIEKDDKVLRKTRKQVDEYFAGKRKNLNIPILTVGSVFQKQVWQELMNIKYGETASYSYLAKRIKNEKAVRAVASAVGANAISLIIPCHRIIRSNGKLGGFAGGILAKKNILKIENESFTTL